MSLKDKLKKCLKEGEIGGERHKGLKRIEINQDLIDKHLEKAAIILRRWLISIK